MEDRKSLIFLGDCFFKTLNRENPFSIIDNELRDSYVICNFETSVYENFHENDNKYVQLGLKIKDIPPDSINQIDVFNLANNHTYDFGKKGLTYTISYLKENNKQIIGIRNYEYLITEVNGKSVGFVGCIAYSGVKRKIYINHKDAFEIIKSIRNKCESIILCVHWGTEYSNYPSPDQRKLASRFINFGADMIVGHHPHVIQGHEKIDGKYVFYSLGNCNFHLTKRWLSIWTDISMILRTDASSMDSVNYKLYQIDDNYCLANLDAMRHKEVERHLYSISKKNIQLSWLKWGAEISPVFIKQEKDAFKKRFKRRNLKQYFIFLYWLTRPKTLFMILSYILSCSNKEKKR